MTKTQKVGSASVVLTVSLVAIGYFLWPENQAAANMNIRGEFVWKCTDCGHVFDSDAEQPPSGDIGLLAGGMAAYVKCPACDKRTGRLAECCPECSTLFFPEYRSLIPTEKDRCPKCGWSRLDDIVAEMRAHGIEPPEELQRPTNDSPHARKP